MHTKRALIKYSRVHGGPKGQQHQHTLGWETEQLETKLSGVFTFLQRCLTDRH